MAEQLLVNFRGPRQFPLSLAAGTTERAWGWPGWQVRGAIGSAAQQPLGPGQQTGEYFAGTGLLAPGGWRC